MVVSHTASLAGSDVLISALFKRLGVARVDTLESLMEALKVLHVLGPLQGGKIGAMSTSGGDLTLLADAMGPDLTMPPLSKKVTQGLRDSIHERMVPANPLDFQMFEWDNEDRMAENFTAFLAAKFDVSLCLLDYPREDHCDQSTWSGAEKGFVRAVKQTGTKGALLATFSDTISEPVVSRLMKQGVASLAGINAGLAGIQAAVDIGKVWNQSTKPLILDGVHQDQEMISKVLSEAESKDLLSRNGIPIPAAQIASNAAEAAAAAESLGYPVVVKALGVAHKTEVGGVKLKLNNAAEVATAVDEMSTLSKSFLIEKMVDNVVAELIIGVVRDDQFGPYLLVGGGGILVEMMKDSVSLLMPTSKEQILEALNQLKCSPLFNGFRGAPPADLGAAADVILAIAAMVEKTPEDIIELDINPLMLLPKGQGVVAADALIRLNMDQKGE